MHGTTALVRAYADMTFPPCLSVCFNEGLALPVAFRAEIGVLVTDSICLSWGSPANADAVVEAHPLLVVNNP